MDLGLAMLQRWWQAYGVHLAVLTFSCVISAAVAWGYSRPLIALLLIWWLKPVYDRAVLHVLSRAVFGELQGVRTTLANMAEWLGSGLFMGLSLRPLGMARPLPPPG